MRLLAATNRIFRVVAMTDGTTITPNADTTDVGTVTIAGNRTMGPPSGSPLNGQRLTLRIKQDATGSRTLTWNSIYRFPGDIVPLLHTAAGKVDTFDFEYNSADTRWECTNLELGASLTGKIVAFNQLTANSATFDFDPKIVVLTTTASVIANRLYQVLVTGEIEHNNASGSGNTTIQNEIRHTTNGSAVAVTSPQIGRGLSFNYNGIPVPVVISVLYKPVTNHTFKVGVVSWRPVPNTNPGGSICNWTADVDRPTTLSVIDHGPAFAAVP